jgi:hypothetical protein
VASGAAFSEPVFILRDITLKGISGNNAALLKVDNGELIMEDGSVVTGNTNSSANSSANSSGGGVYVSGGGTLTMRDSAALSGNTAASSASSQYAPSYSYSYGGGVYVAEGGTFAMQDGASVNGNTASSESEARDYNYGNPGSYPVANSYSYGGGVYVAEGGTFTIQGSASVSGNTAYSYSKSFSTTAPGSYSYSHGGGVYVAEGGTFAMLGGASVSGNTASSAYSVGTFYYYSSCSYGGGVYVADGGFFTIQDSASVSGYTASSGSDAYGGGVYVAAGGTFAIQGSVSVSGNTASSGPNAYGGGVYVADGGIFTKGSGSTIYGSDTDDALKNTAGYANYGPAVFINSSPVKIRYSTAGTGVTLDSAVDGTAGGWDPHPISNITYSSVSGGDWTPQNDGRRRSPVIADSTVTKVRVSFTTNVAAAFITVQLDVDCHQAESAFISTLDNASATYDSGYYEGSKISGIRSAMVNIPVSTPGSHFIEICYRKDDSGSAGEDCAWFKIIQ